MTLETLKSMLETHDWFYTYSDDHRYYKRGQEESEKIHAEIERLSEEGLRVEACRLYNEMKPDEFFDLV